MSNDVDAEVIQTTQKILGKHVKKPALTDKLLRKPPFRFLHDIVTGVIRETGFLKGLYSERELVSENVKDKDEKIAFLNKLIEAIKTITGTELTVRASKIIAGLEPGETNALLQAIGTALNKKLSSVEYIAQLKSGKKSKSQTSIPVSEKKLKSVKSKDKVDGKPEGKAKVSSTPRVAQKNQDGDKLKVVKTLSKESKESTRNEVAKKEKKTKENISTQEQIVKGDKSRKKSLNENTSPELTPTVTNELNKNEQAKLTEQNRATNIFAKEDETSTAKNILKEDLNIETEDGQEINVKPKADLEEANKISTTNAVTRERVKSAKVRKDSLKTNNEEANPIPVTRDAIKERVKSAKPRSGNLKNDNTEPTLAAPPQIDNHLEAKLLVRPRSSLRPPSVRPSSARPGAPRLRSDTSLPEGEVIPLGKVNVIVESYNNKEIDEEETVTIQAAPEAEFQPPILQLPTDKGHLVEQILEQIHHDDVMEHAKPTVNIEWEQDGFRSRNAASKEIEQLKSAIQMLTRTANPLGKLVNYLHEDIEAMHSELDMWINSARQIMVDVASQKRISDESNKPLQGQLEEIEDNIVKHQQQIVSVHGNILRNEQHIQDLLIK